MGKHFRVCSRVQSALNSLIPRSCGLGIRLSTRLQSLQTIYFCFVPKVMLMLSDHWREKKERERERERERESCTGFISWNHCGESRLTKEHFLLSNCVSATDNQGAWVAPYGSQCFLNCKLYNRLLIREVIPRTAVPTWSNKHICHQWLCRNYSLLLGSQYLFSYMCENKERDLVMRMTSMFTEVNWSKGGGKQS